MDENKEQQESRNALNIGNAFTLDTEFKKDMLLSFYDWPQVESSTILSTQNTKTNNKRKQSIFKQENYISSSNCVVPDDVATNEINLRETIEEAPKARRNLNIKLIHQRKGRLLKHRATQESPLGINKKDSSDTAEVLPAFGGEGRKTRERDSKLRERDSKMRFSYNMPQLTKVINPDLRLSVKDLASSRCNVLHEFENQQKSSNYNSCLNSQRSLSIADTFSQSKNQNTSKINL